MRRYRQLTLIERVYIEACHWQRVSHRSMARKLRVDSATISRELRRGATGELGIGYRADIAESRRREAVKRRGRKPKVVGELAEYVKAKLIAGWSPEQISGRLRLEGQVSVSHETIYKFIKADKDSGGGLYLYLRHGRRKRRKRFAVPRMRADILARRHISERPASIHKRSRIGDWERDLMFGDSRQQALLVFVDRKTKFTLLHPLPNKSPRQIAKASLALMSGQPCLSITNDNGFEFRDHVLESQKLGIPIYFTTPYSSWEKGTVENTNGLIRQYFPQNFPMKEMTYEKALNIQTNLNSRPRKSLGFRTPLEVFQATRSQRLKSSDL